MSMMKKMLGLEGFPLSDEEISRQLNEACFSNKEVVEFIFGSKRKTVKVHPVAREGIMREYDAYYAR
ncbi:MAG: hypothetical protein AABX13_02655 [Nanoarchaeota archaeon]